MSLKSAVLATSPTSYWPLDDAASSNRLHDECGLHDGLPVGPELATMPFGASRMPKFSGRLGISIVIPDDERYAHTYANALTVACWLAPSKLDFEHTDGQTDQFVHVIEKGVNYTRDAEWAFRLYNATNEKRHSRLSFYLFNLGHPVCKGAGSYMQFGKSRNDKTEVVPGRWLFLVGQGQSWSVEEQFTHGAILYKQGVRAEDSEGDKYNYPEHWNVRPQHGPGVIYIGGSIGKTAFAGSIGHVALWNRLVTCDEVKAMFDAGQAELGEHSRAS